MRTFLAASAVALVAFTGQLAAQPVRNNPGFTTNTLARNDDSSTGAVPIGFNINFFGFNSSTLFVNNNGNVTFTGPLGTFTPFNLATTGTRIIAPFFADVDTRNLASGVVQYGTSTVNGRPAFGVNWFSDIGGVQTGVGYFNNQATNLNTFQLVIIERSDRGAGDFDFEFNYNSITWESGTASGGNSNGLGGNSARIGFSNGTVPANPVGSSFELGGSGVNGAFLNTGPASTSLINNFLVPEGSGVTPVFGRYLFAVSSGVVIPEPTSMLAILAGVCGVVGFRSRRRA